MGDNKTGRILWYDLTVDDADKVSDFYTAVTGWEKEGLSMGDYDDYLIKDQPGGEVISGICHARGVNKGIPPQWLMYIQVENLDASLQKCIELGGKVLGEKRKMNESYYCLIRDPAGAHVMLCGD